MKKPNSSKYAWVFFLVYYILFFAVLNRELPNYIGTKDQWLVISLYAAYAVLLGLERVISRRIPFFIYLYFVLQLGIITWMLLIPNDNADQDYFVNLVLPLGGQAVWSLNDKIAKYPVIFFSLFCLGTMVLYYPGSEGVSFGLTYIVGLIVISVLSLATKRADNAQMKSQILLEELTVANEKLKIFSRQAEEMAVAEERNRLARELHDSVTQIIFGMTLSAQAARILIDRDKTRAAQELDNLQTLSQNALSEMRSLIQQLHPQKDIESGLVSAIKKLSAQHLIKGEVAIDLQLKGDRRFPAHIESELYRVVQEAMNNIVKHAKAKNVVIALDLENPNQIELNIKDDGIGFDPQTVRSIPGHLGLTSMQERIKDLGGTLDIDSHPGNGTCINIVIDRQKEVQNV